jgi:RNA polymerase-associated protein CTR9
MSSNRPNGQNGGASKGANDIAPPQRFSNVPSTLDIPVLLDQKDEDDADAVEIYLENLSDPNELCSLLETEHAAHHTG